MSIDKNHFVVNIVCPADNTLRPMEINAVDLPSGEKFVLPVNGCVITQHRISAKSAELPLL